MLAKLFCCLKSCRNCYCRKREDLISEGMDHLQNQLVITNLLKRVNIPNQIFKKMIKDNQSGNLIKYNNNMVLKDYSDSDTNSEQSHESEDDVHLAKRNLTKQIK